MSSFLTPVITSWLSPVVRFVMTFWLKGNKLPSFVQFTAGAGSPLTVQWNVTLDPISALWFSGGLIIVGFLPSIKGNKNVFFYTTSNNPNLLLLTKLTVKSYLQLTSLKNYSVKALFKLLLSIKKKRHLISIEKIHFIKNISYIRKKKSIKKRFISTELN